MNVMAQLLHPYDDILIEDGDTLLLGGYQPPLNPDGKGYFPVHDYLKEKLEVETL